MKRWYKGLIVPRMRVLLSKTGYTNIKLALIYLEHLN
jgi:hypothetical protein